MKQCSKCKKTLEFSEFHKYYKSNDGYYSSCKVCKASGTDRRKKMLKRVEKRAKDRGMEFNLTIDDIVIPELCPLLGIPLRTVYGGIAVAQPDSASLDRINNDMGYVKGNVWVVSHKANTIMSYATADEIIAVGVGLKRKQENLNSKQLDLI